MTALPPILLVHTGSVDVVGGANIHTTNLYKTLLEAHVKVCLLVSACSKMEQLVQEYGLPYQTISQSGIRANRLMFKLFLTCKLIKICRQLGPCIVQCNLNTEVWAAKVAGYFVPIKIIYNRHSIYRVKPRRLRGVTGALGSGRQTVAMLTQQNTKIQGSIKYIDDLPMFYDQTRFLQYQPSEDRQTFYRKYFSCIIPKQSVLLCTIANLYSNIDHKNYPLLFKAVAYLCLHKGTKIHVVIVGDGPAKDTLKTITRELGIAHEVHFLDFTHKVPGILYHSDIFVLPSREEAFGIAYLEAALMKKPLVGATGTGAEGAIIIHEKTGLLFKNNDVEDLVCQLERLIENPALRMHLSQHAYAHVRAQYSNEVGLQKMLAFYQKIARTEQP